MLNRFCRGSAVLAVLACAVACEGSRSAPFSPSRLRQPAPASSPTPAPPRTPITFPPLSGSSRTFVFDRELQYPVTDYTKQSRFVLFDNGACVLEYPSIGFSLPGQYRATNSALLFLFEFDGRTADEEWDDAIGTLRGDSLTIEFELNMQMADFENAVYVLSR